MYQYVLFVRRLWTVHFLLYVKDAPPRKTERAILWMIRRICNFTTLRSCTAWDLDGVKERIRRLGDSGCTYDARKMIRTVKGYTKMKRNGKSLKQSI